jgi:hypothetical protein
VRSFAASHSPSFSASLCVTARRRATLNSDPDRSPRNPNRRRPVRRADLVERAPECTAGVQAWTKSGG